MGNSNSTFHRIYNWFGRVSSWELIASILIFAGIVLTPSPIRYSLFIRKFLRYGSMNLLVLLAVIALLQGGRRFDVTSKIGAAFIMLASVGVFLSNGRVDTMETVLFLVNCMIPTYLALYVYDKASFERLSRYIIIVFDCFIVVLLMIALIEQFTDQALTKMIYAVLPSNALYKYLNWERGGFAFLWGHPLTNAVFFNFFYFINDAYFDMRGKKYPKLVFLGISLVGILLCGAKLAFMILVLYFLVSSYKDKRILLAALVCAVILFAVGGFDFLIQRMTGMSFSSGRVEAIIRFFADDPAPLKWFSGYGTDSVVNQRLVPYVAALELPILYWGEEYGLIAAGLLLIVLYIYPAYRLIRNKRWKMLFSYSLLYAEFNAYNGMCYRAHDVLICMCVMIMLYVNIAAMNPVARPAVPHKPGKLEGKLKEWKARRKTA